jgi:putative membrane protein
MFSIFAKGIVLGIGAILPGISGGSLAVIFGLYEKLIHSVGNFFQNPKKNFVFLAVIGSGAGLGIVLFSNIQKFLFTNYEIPTMLLLCGLFLGTVPGLFKQANKNGFSASCLLPFLIAFIISIYMSLHGNNDMEVKAEDLHMNFKNFTYIFIIGFIMAGSLVIPGISGTVLLMLMGAYGFFLKIIADIKYIFLFPFVSNSIHGEIINNIIVMIPLCLGLGAGAFLFSRLMDFLLKKSYSLTYYALLGFMLGSVPELIPKYTGSFSLYLTGIILFLAGFAVSIKFNSKYVA